MSNPGTGLIRRVRRRARIWLPSFIAAGVRVAQDGTIYVAACLGTGVYPSQPRVRI
jgi:hypothetical protein